MKWDSPDVPLPAKLNLQVNAALKAIELRSRLLVLSDQGYTVSSLREKLSLAGIRMVKFVRWPGSLL